VSITKNSPVDAIAATSGVSATTTAGPLKTTAPAASKGQRISALDFTKGALVLIMVLYHWIDYFVGPGGYYFRYLRFLTPSFICISGFLISSVYLAKYAITDRRIPKRLFERGLKILGVFITLNVIISFATRSSYNGKILFADMSPEALMAIFVTGNTLLAGGKAVAFYVLVPISYLLLLSAALMIATRYFRYTFQVALFCCLLAILILNFYGLQSPNLELIAIGFLGVIIGFIPFEKINAFLGHVYLLLLAYACYLAAITVWNVIYPFQIFGVCLSLALIYLVGARTADPGSALKRIVVLLGKYSLLGYIVQIVILQFLRRAFQRVDLGTAVLPVSFISAAALTIISVYITDRQRTKSTLVDGLYRAIFS
jgi:peptidoglycan/LPS O-acetylase OafA/YrhL